MNEIIPYPCFDFTHALHAQLSTTKEADKVIDEYVQYILKSIQTPSPDVNGTRTVTVGLRIKEKLFVSEAAPDNHPVMLHYLSMIDKILIQLPGRLRQFSAMETSEHTALRLEGRKETAKALKGEGPYANCFLPYAEGVTVILSAAAFSDALPMMMGVSLYNGTYIPGKYMQHPPVHSFTTCSYEVKRETIDAGH